jgi:hypothetical protein
MKKLLLISLALFFAFPLFSQKKTRFPAVPKITISPGGAELPVSVPAAAPTMFRSLEQLIGLTQFDLQTANSLGRRVADLGGGKVSAVWLYGVNQAVDRGTAYNYFNGTEWGEFPMERIEELRSGYPCLTTTASGLEVITSHQNIGSQWYISTHTKMPGDTDWTRSEIPSTVPGGPVWTKVATGGPDGNTIHVVAVSVPTGSGGVIYEGIENHPLYYRSLDGGQTWDKSDVIIPGLDSSFYNSFGGESYNIDAHGETVAIAVFDSWGDVAVFKSEDNGETWTKKIVNDFPLDKYDEMGYGPGDIPFDPEAPDSISMRTADYCGSVLVDNEGKVHVFFGLMYVYAIDAAYYLHPDTDGLAYWNEDYATGDLKIIANADLNGDGEVALTDLVRYLNVGFTAMPSAGIDATGNLYVVYTSVHEEYVSSITDQNFRHPFIVKSEDGGDTWSAPYDLLNLETNEFPELYEGVFPSIPSRINSSLHLVYEQDDTPGLTASGVQPPDQSIIYLNLDKNTFGMVNSTHETGKSDFQMNVSPNPSGGEFRLKYHLPKTSDVSFTVSNLVGTSVTQVSQKTQVAGQQEKWFDLSNLPKGIYFIKLAADGRFVTEKVVVR